MSAGNKTPTLCEGSSQPANDGVSDARSELLHEFDCFMSHFRPRQPGLEDRLRTVFKEKIVAALAQSRPPSTQSGEEVHVCARECDACNHVGINDEHEENATCNTCGWSGPSPKEDLCPQCGSEGTMSAACPKCSGHYSLIAERDLAPQPAGGGKEAPRSTSPAHPTDPLEAA